VIGQARLITREDVKSSRDNHGYEFGHLPLYSHAPHRS